MDHWPEQLRAVWGDSLDDLRAEIEEARRLERLREMERLRAEAFFRGSGGGGGACELRVKWWPDWWPF